MNKIKLFGLLMFVAVVQSIWAMSDYKVQDGKLIIGVPGGETNRFDSANWLATLTDNLVTDVLKEGDGGLVMDADISAYSGAIHITNGTWRVVDSKGLGQLQGGGAVYVTSGATLEGKSSEKSGIQFPGKTIYFEGRGKNGIGALVIDCSANQQAATWGSTMVMTGDAFINGLNDWHYYFNTVTLNMQGHTLTLNNYGLKPKQRGRLIVCRELTIQNPGTIELINKTGLQLYDRNTFNGSADNRLVVRDSAYIQGSEMRGYYKWTLDWQSAGTNNFGELNQYSNYPRNTWEGPVVLRRQMAINANPTAVLSGSVSGAGGLTVKASGSSAAELVLNCPTNSFLGGVTTTNVVVRAVSGAIPADGGTLQVVNADLPLDDVAPYALPTGVVSVATANVVSNGVGSWKRFVKTGDGRMDYKSRVGAEELSVEGGSFHLQGTGEDTWMAGVVEGIGYYSEREDAYSDMASRLVYRTSIQSYPQHLYTSYGHADRKSQTWCEIPSNRGGYLICYTGYLWNRKSTNVTWTFAGTLGAQSILVIDGTTVFHNVNTKICSHENVVLTPGAHSFYIANASKINDGGTSNSPTNMTWNKKGIMYDPRGRNSTNEADYSQLKNPTDGSLPILTWCKPGEVTVTPVPDKIFDRAVVISGGTATNVADYALFSKMSFASGTTVDFSGLAYGIDGLGGIPTVLHSDGLSVSEKWTVDVADILAGRKLSGVPLAFGDDAELVITQSVRPRNGSWVIAESTEDIVGNLAIKDELLLREWRVTVSGRQVILSRQGPGMVLIVR